MNRLNEWRWLSPHVWFLSLTMATLASSAQAQSFVYVTNFANTVSVINTANNNVVATIPVGNFPNGLAVNPNGTRIYVVNYGDGTVSVIDTANNNVVATVPVGFLPQMVAVSPD